MKFVFRDKVLDYNSPPVLIAEAGVGHFGSIENAYRLIDLAKISGCQTIKFQHFCTEDLVADSDSEWTKRLSSRDTTVGFIKKIYEYASKENIHCFFTPHTEKALQDIISLGYNDVIKIGSGERGNKNFIRKALDNSDFVIISTGTYEDNDLMDLRDLLSNYPPYKSCVLHCNTIYPTPYEKVNLQTISYLKKIFSGISNIGYSDHTEGIAVPIAALAFDIRVIEKHISLEKDIPNAQDWKVSCFRDDLPVLVKSINQVWLSTKNKVNKKELSQIELLNKKWANKSCYLIKDLYPNNQLTRDYYKEKRPFNGLAPDEVEGRILGKKYLGKEILKKGYSLNKEDLQKFSLN